MQIQKLEHLPQEWKPQEISESKYLEIINALKVCDADEQQIREALRYCMVKIGLRAANYPVDIEKVLLIQHIYEFFPTITIPEIRLAFDWAIEGRTDVDVNCYENFSCRYFSQIVLAYIKLKESIKVVPEYKQLTYKKEERIEGNYEEFKNSEFAQRLRNLGINVPE